MESIRFAEWLAKNHFTLRNVIGSNCYWNSESYNEGMAYTTEQLLFEFLKDEK